MGTSGVTATGGPGHWFVPPEGHDAAIARQLGRTEQLAQADWMARVLDLTWRYLPTIAPWYPFGSDGRGGRYVQGVRGPEYMRALRRMCAVAGIAVLDHHPALELLAAPDGTIVGARGVALASGEDWEIRAGATVLATGGCAFRSGLIGSHTQTGDGLLMAAEAGAALSGMEFSIAYSLSPAWASTRTLPFTAARFSARMAPNWPFPRSRPVMPITRRWGRPCCKGRCWLTFPPRQPGSPPFCARSSR
jgi:hypothetical protein